MGEKRWSDWDQRGTGGEKPERIDGVREGERERGRRERIFCVCLWVY
jgi:hypothetical protein